MIEPPLLVAFQWLIDLLDEPKDIPILAPLIQREIFYHLLVGYESPSQFSREYNRLFGAPPLRDIANLRLMAIGENA